MMVATLSFSMAPNVQNKASMVECVLLAYVLLGIMHYNASVDLHTPSHKLVENMFA
jgi:hypothetical protein